MIITPAPRSKIGGSSGHNNSIFFDPETIHDNNEAIMDEFIKKEKELKNTIQEQLNVILQLEHESKELRNKNYDYKLKNENIARELEDIKKDFKNISESLCNKKICKEISIQTDQSNCSSLNTSAISTSNASVCKDKDGLRENAKDNSGKNVNTAIPATSNTKVAPKKGSSNNLNKTSTNTNNKKFATKMQLAKPNASTTNKEELNKSSNVSINSLSQFENEKSGIEGENVRNLKFDNSVLMQELNSLSKENMKFKNEFKTLSENLKKIEKERNDLKRIYQVKSENFDKIKKENEEIMILIQGANYKSLINLEVC